MTSSRGPAAVEGFGRRTRQHAPRASGGRGPSRGRACDLLQLGGRAERDPLSEPRIPEDEGFEGVFLIIVGRAPGNVEHTYSRSASSNRSMKAKRSATISDSSSGYSKCRTVGLSASPVSSWPSSWRRMYLCLVPFSTSGLFSAGKPTSSSAPSARA